MGARRRMIVAEGVALCVLLLAIAVHVRARERAEWVAVKCWSNACVATALNALDPERAAEAKLTTWQDVTYVWHRR